MPETPARNVRIPDDLWAALKARAAEEHATVTALVIRAVLRELEGTDALRSRNLVAGELVAPMLARVKREAAVEALREVAKLPINPEDFRGSFALDADLIEAGAGLLRRAIRERAASLSGATTLKR